MDARIITSIACFAAAVGCIVASSIYFDRAREEQEALRTQHLADCEAESRKMMANIQTLAADLDKKLETAKFWDIVTRNP